MTGEGEIFYLQKRIGINRQSFHLLKFATMLKNSPKLLTGSITIKNDPRVLPFGKILRKTKINELPQLLNVLRGDMSLVGPRPLTEETFDGYIEIDKQIITTVRPGITGIGSIVFRDEETILYNLGSSTDIYFLTISPYKAELEKWYIQNATLINYFKIIFLTIVVLVNPQSNLIWKLLKNLPKIPSNLVKVLGY